MNFFWLIKKFQIALKKLNKFFIKLTNLVDIYLNKQIIIKEFSDNIAKQI